MRENAIYLTTPLKIRGTTAKIYSIFSDTQNIFRKILQEYSCTVIDSTDKQGRATYYFIVGTTDYVKDIYDTIPGPDNNIFVITQSDTSISTLLKHIKTTHTRVALVDTFVLSERAIKEIFAYFFVSDSQVQHFSAGTHKQRVSNPQFDRGDDTNSAPGKPKISQNLREEGRDEKRISELIRSTYKKDSRLQKIFGRKHMFTRRHFFVQIIFLFLSPLLFYAISMYISLSTGLSCLLLASQGNALASRASCLISKTSFNTAKGIYIVATPLSYLPFVNTIYKNQQHSLSMLRLIFTVYDECVRVMTRLTRDDNIITRHSTSLIPIPAPDAMGSIADSVSVIQTNAGLLRAEFMFVNSNHIFPLVPPLYKNALLVEARLNTFYDYIHKGSVFLRAYPSLLGLRESSPYVVFFQNSSEIRPTGGFLGSLGFLTATDGYISDLVIRDVYDLDGQLKGHIDPPDPIRLMLGNEHWYLRDSNWEYEIPVAAKQMLWFIEKETGQNLQGAIFINSHTLESFLRIIGPVNLPDYNVVVNAQNVIDVVSTRVQSDFFPGSTQKRDILSSLFHAMLEKIQSSDAKTLFALIKTALDLFKTRDIAIYSTNDSLQSLLASAGWTGDVVLGEDCARVQNCVSLFTYPVEANLGVNKVNPYILREDESTVSISEDGEIRQTIQLSYTNTAKDVPTTGGAYKTYLRIVLPKDALITDVSIDSESVPKMRSSFVESPSSLTLPYYEPLLDEARGNTVVGIGFLVPPESKKTLVVHVQYPRVFAFHNEGALAFSYLRQPGFSGVTWRGIVNYPSSWQALFASKHTGQNPPPGAIIAKPGQIQYNNNLSHDNDFVITFIK